MFFLVQLLVPISITVVLPVLIVWIIFRFKTNKDNKNAQIIIKALENHSEIDTDHLVEALSSRRRSPAELLRLRLLRGCMFTLLGLACGIYTIFWVKVFFLPILAMILLAIGLAYLIVYYVTRRENAKSRLENACESDNR